MTATHKQMSNAEYHADRSADSWSCVKDFIKNPLEYRDVHYLRTRSRPEPTEDMVTGSIMHTLLAEHPVWWVIRPDGLNGNSNEYKALKADCTEKGYTLIKASQFTDARAMQNSIWQDDLARSLVEQCDMREYPIFWTDAATGLPLKCCLDCASFDFIIDFKSTRDPDPPVFEKQMANLLYHRQAAMYCDGFTEMFSVWPKFYFIAVRNTPPYECSVNTLDQSTIEQAVIQNAKTLASLAKAKADDKFDPPWKGKVNTLSLPVWAMEPV